MIPIPQKPKVVFPGSAVGTVALHMLLLPRCCCDPSLLRCDVTAGFACGPELTA
jgi:hypothetical protein